jgi:predicted nucleic acid-binding protein
VGEIVPVTGTLKLCRDPKDDVVIETAVAGQVAVLVSGDRDLTDDSAIATALDAQGIRVLTASQFAQELANQTL